MQPNRLSSFQIQNSSGLVDPLTGELSFPHEKGTEQSKKHNHDHEGEAFVDRRPVTVAHDLRDIGVQLLDVVETFSDSVNDLVNVFAVSQALS
jgi:hypothetical protein